MKKIIDIYEYLFVINDIILVYELFEYVVSYKLR